MRLRCLALAALFVAFAFAGQALAAGDNSMWGDNIVCGDGIVWGEEAA